MTTAIQNVVFAIPNRFEKWQLSVLKKCIQCEEIEVKAVISCHRPRKIYFNLIKKTHITLDKIFYKRHQEANQVICFDGLMDKSSPASFLHKTAFSEEGLIQELKNLEPSDGTLLIDFTHSVAIESALKELPSLTLIRLEFGNSSPKTSDLVGYNEIVKHDSEIEVFVTESNSSSKNKIRSKACYKLFPASLSKTRNYLLWRSVGLLFDTIPRSSLATNGMYKSSRPASIFSIFGYAFEIARLAWKKKFLTSHWSLALERTDILPDSMANYAELEQPMDRFWADPFIIRDGSKVHVFLEELEYSKAKGDLAHFIVEKDGRIGPCQKILEKDYHLSYPFIFKVNETYFMVPETSENKTIDLYRCESFPEKWVFQKTLMKDVVAADTTLFFHDSKWWMFTTMDTGSRGSNDDELFLFYADSHDSHVWTPHPLNPIIRDVRCARPAGKIFIDPRNRIIRPSQDCSAYYGRGLNLNEIVTLSTTEFEERRLKRIDAADHPIADGIHTYNNDVGISIIDQFRWTR
ncbi:hypothetical protein MLD52_10750 [Puniceicoccaceae bacterium K14]|nr:hypothetical protein [Puniceicoccaceae bacterium K14]